jgi:hypothetical protein
MQLKRKAYAMRRYWPILGQQPIICRTVFPNSLVRQALGVAVIVYCLHYTLTFACSWSENASTHSIRNNSHGNLKGCNCVLKFGIL